MARLLEEESSIREAWRAQSAGFSMSDPQLRAGRASGDDDACPHVQSLQSAGFSISNPQLRAGRASGDDDACRHVQPLQVRSKSDTLLLQPGAGAGGGAWRTGDELDHVRAQADLEPRASLALGRSRSDLSHPSLLGASPDTFLQAASNGVARTVTQAVILEILLEDAAWLDAHQTRNQEQIRRRNTRHMITEEHAIPTPGRAFDEPERQSHVPHSLGQSSKSVAAHDVTWATQCGPLNPHDELTTEFTDDDGNAIATKITHDLLRRAAY